jgi:hypothetical protein
VIASLIPVAGSLGRARHAYAEGQNVAGGFHAFLAVGEAGLIAGYLPKGENFHVVTAVTNNPNLRAATAQEMQALRLGRQAQEGAEQLWYMRQGLLENPVYRNLTPKQQAEMRRALAEISEQNWTQARQMLGLP